MRRTGKIDWGRWRIERERCGIPDGTPPPPPFEDAAGLGQVLPNVLKRLGLDTLAWLDEVRSQWPEAVGAQVAAHSRPGPWRQGTLTVYVANPIWLSEISRYHRGHMLDALRRRFGAERIRAISIQADPGAGSSA